MSLFSEVNFPLKRPTDERRSLRAAGCTDSQRRASRAAGGEADSDTEIQFRKSHILGKCIIVLSNVRG